MEEAKHRIRNAQRVIVYTGAGMSVDSNIAPFRKKGGLWNGIFGSIILPFFGTTFGWKYFPEFCWKKYLSHFLKPILLAKPHEGYEVLSLFESEKPMIIITTNVDGLHKRSGSSHVIELHGSVMRNMCNSVGNSCSRKLIPFSNSSCPDCGSFPRPDVVLFGETLQSEKLDECEDLIVSMNENDVFLQIGSSGVVNPSRQICEYIVYKTNTFTIEINKNKSPVSNDVDVYLEGSAKTILQELFSQYKKTL
jgi:NAD-dependent deacetylase